MESTYPFQGDHQAGGAAEKNNELILHFDDFDKMGMRDNARDILLDDIISAHGVGDGSDGVSHLVAPPNGKSSQITPTSKHLKESNSD